MELPPSAPFHRYWSRAAWRAWFAAWWHGLRHLHRIDSASIPVTGLDGRQARMVAYDCADCGELRSSATAAARLEGLTRASSSVAQGKNRPGARA